MYMKRYFNGICITFTIFCIFVFLLLSLIQINTPMHSDDYWYSSIGGDFSALSRHYLNWSGRLAADITSSSIISFLPKNVYSALNSLALVILLLLCSILPSFVMKQKLLMRDSATFLVIFLMYWVSNTNLFQTTFWVVGAANYVWTSLYILTFLCVFSFVTSRDGKITHIPVVFLLGFIGGVTNENTGWITSAFVLFCYLNHNLNKDSSLVRSIYASGFLGGLLGWLTLILAPGNSSRALNFQSWYSKDIYERIDLHLYDRLPEFLTGYTILFVVIIFAFATQMALTPSLNIKYIFNEKSCEVRQSATNRLFLFFITCGALSVLMLIGAPVMVARVGNGTLIFFLMALSSLMYSLNRADTERSASAFRYVVIISISAIYFIPSYYLVYSSTKRLSYQEQVRNELVRSSVKAGFDSVSIPAFYSTRLIKGSDRIDSFHNGKAMAEYYGGALKVVNAYRVEFDYSAIIKNEHEIVIDKKIANGLMLHKIMFYSEPGWPFFKKRHFALFELNASPSLVLANKDKHIFFHVLPKNNNKLINADIGRPSAVKIGSKFYISRPLPSDALDNGIKMIEFGVYDLHGASRDSDISITL